MHSEGGEAPDATSAGNALVAALSAGIAAGLDLPLAARIARLAAAIAADRPATSVVREADLLAALSEQGGAQRKVVTRAHAAEQVERWRARGWRIGFTNGCFDLLHPGHVHLLEQARATCDRLVVGLNGDASVTRLKGEGRPVQTQDARAAVLASLSFVDLVCVFDEDTPVELLQSLQPDVLIKGADYALDAVIGADLVQGWGGSVKLAELLPGHSTSATVERLRG
jgi:D-beta-D-heptose 7-phosphate kinase/D-beta-D-heptose 1-phosphate adenosyltransferase